MININDDNFREIRRLMIDLVELDDYMTLKKLLSDSTTLSILTDDQKNDLFIIACRRDAFFCVDMLFNLGFNKLSPFKVDPAMSVCVAHDSIRSLNYLISKGYDVKQIMSNGDPLIFMADGLAFHLLIKHGALDDMSDEDLLRLAPYSIYQCGDLSAFKEIYNRVDLTPIADDLIECSMMLDNLDIFFFLISSFAKISDHHLMSAIYNDRLIAFKALIDRFSYPASELLKAARCAEARACIPYLEELSLMQYEKNELEEALAGSGDESGKNKSGGRL